MEKKTIIIHDNDINIIESLINLNNNKFKFIVYFKLKKPKKFLKEFKKLIISRDINFDKFDFTSLNEFINFVTNSGIYLPRNINLFLIQPCFNGCSFCDRKYDFINGYSLPLKEDKDYLPFKYIKAFFENYSPSLSTNVNLSGEGDPILHPEFKEIVKFLKEKGYHITLFLGGKSLLQYDNNFLDKYIDIFKLNVGASNYDIYNKTHLNKITEYEFKKLLIRIKNISKNHYVNIISVVNNNNFSDIYNQYKMSLLLGVKSFEIKIDHEFPINSLLKNKNIYNYYINLIKKISSEKKINICSDFRSDLTKYIFIPEIEKSTILDDIYQENITNGFDISKLEKLNICKQFGHSIFLNYDRGIYVCCIKEVGRAGSILSEKPYHKQDIFKKINITYEKKTPEICKECPIRVDRIKNIFKYIYIKSL